MKNAKLSVMLAGLLVMSMFSGALAFAKEGSDDEAEIVSPTVPTIGVLEVNTEGIESTDVIEIDDVDLTNVIGTKYRKASLLNYRSLSGGLENTESGFLANVGFLSVALVNKDDSTTTKVAAGRLQIMNSERNTKYKLIASGNKVQEGVLEFYVLPKESRLGNLDDAASVKVGTFTLTQKKSFLTGYSRWSGVLTLDGQSTWEGTFYSSKIKTVKPITQDDRKKDKELQEIEDGVGKGKTEGTRPMPSERIDNSGKGSIESEREAAKQAREQAKEARKYWWQFWKARQVEADAQLEVSAGTP